MGEKLDNILADLPKFEAELDEEGKKFSGRLLDNIFRRGNSKEINLLCQFSALFGASPKELIRQLPAFNQTAFDTLVNRRKFIWKDASDLFNSHAMIKDYAYDKLINKEAIHQHLGKYFERKLFAIRILNSTVLESAIQHYKRVSLFELKKFGERVDKIFNITNVKSLIENDVKDTIRNYKNLLDVYPGKMAYYNELGIALRSNRDIDEAIKTFLKAIEIDPKQKQAYLSLLQVYLFFKPDIKKGKEYFDKCDKPPHHSSFRNRRSDFLLYLKYLDSIWNLHLDEFKIYSKYVFQGIEYNLIKV